jgi:hypothetical protein
MTESNAMNSAVQLENFIINTIKEMAEVYSFAGTQTNVKQDKGRAFSDGYENRGLTNTAEALCCITIPYFSMKPFTLPFWKGEIIDHSIIRESVEYLLDGYKENDPGAYGTLGFGGTPYIDFRFRGEEKDGVRVKEIETNLDFVDSACFVISAITDIKAMELHRRFLIAKGTIPQSTPQLISDDVIKRIDKRITDGFKVIIGADCGPGNGYQYTSEIIETGKLDFVYFTWDVLEVLEAIYPYVKKNTHVLPEQLINNEGILGSRNLQEWFIETLADKLAYFTGRFLSPNDNPKQYMGKRMIDFSTDTKSDRSLYYNLFAILGLLCAGCREFDELSKALKFIVDEYNSKVELRRMVRKNYTFTLEGELDKKYELNKEWNERAFEALFLKSISMMHSKYFNKEWPVGLIDLCRQMQTDLFKSITNDRCKNLTLGDKKLNNLWDAGQYSIYYTQRVIEAICRYYQDLYEVDGKVPSYVDDLASSTEEKGSSALVPAQFLTNQQTNAVIIKIDSDTIKESLINDASSEISQHIKKEIESLDKGMILNLVKDKLSIEIENIINEKTKKILDNTLRTYFSDLAERIKTGKLKSGDDMISEGIRNVASLSIDIESELAMAIVRAADGKVEDKKRIADLTERIKGAFKLLAAEDIAKPIDFTNSVSKALEKGIIISKSKIKI